MYKHVLICLLFTLHTVFAQTLRMPDRRFPNWISVSLNEPSAFLIQESDDAINWRSYINVYARTTNFTLADLTPTNQVNATQLYKIAGAVLDADLMAQHWRDLQINHYRFHFSRVCFCDVTYLSADVTVQNGVVVSFENARNGSTPIANAQLSWFVSIEEMFSEVLARKDSSDMLYLRYDADRFFPSWIYINRDLQLQDEEIQYGASDLVILDP